MKGGLGGSLWWVICSKCQANTNAEYTKEKAAKWWNRRVDKKGECGMGKHLVDESGRYNIHQNAIRILLLDGSLESPPGEKIDVSMIHAIIFEIQYHLQKIGFSKEDLPLSITITIESKNQTETIHREYKRTAETARECGRNKTRGEKR